MKHGRAELIPDASLVHLLVIDIGHPRPIASECANGRYTGRLNVADQLHSLTIISGSLRGGGSFEIIVGTASAHRDRNSVHASTTMNHNLYTFYEARFPT